MSKLNTPLAAQFYACLMIRVLIVSPNSAVRQGLVALCQTEPEIEVSQTSIGNPGAFHTPEAPHIALVDGQNFEESLDHVRQIKQKFPKTVPLLLVDRLNSDAIWQAARAGVIHCLLKQDSSHQLVPTILAYYQQLKKVDKS